MTQVNMQQVKELRDRTQAGLNDCRAAMVEAGGDMEKAVEIILKKGLAKSAKRAGAIAAEGLVIARVAADAKSGVLVEVNIQTDFAARNADFVKFAETVADVAMKAKSGADLGAETYPGSSDTVEATRQALVGKLGENITVRRWERVSLDGAGAVKSYVHMGGKIGVLLAARVASAASEASPVLAKYLDDTAMQVAAMAPLYLSPSEVPADAKKKQGEIYDAQLVEEGKPEAARPKIVEGKIAKWMKEVCLLEQQSVLDADKSVDEQRKALSKELGGDVTLSRFARFQCGEGIDKPVGDDFAAEVAKMAGG
ncbi:MAG: translation elongation factor Ts [Polyangiaceae bacterium]